MPQKTCPIIEILEYKGMPMQGKVYGKNMNENMYRNNPCESMEISNF